MKPQMDPIKFNERDLMMLKPFSGLFDNKSRRLVLQEMVSDPSGVYRQNDLKYLLQLTEPSVRDALNFFIEIGMVQKVRESQQSDYTINDLSKRYWALRFLSLAIGDDNYNTDLMDNEIFNYFVKIKEKFNRGVLITKSSILAMDGDSVVITESVGGTTDGLCIEGRGGSND